MTLKELVEQIQDNLAITCLQHNVDVATLKLSDMGKCSDTEVLYILLPYKKKL